MTEGRFSVKINAHEGVVEIDGDDKEWIAAQLDKLAVVYATPHGAARRHDKPQPEPERQEQAKNGSDSTGSSGASGRRPRRGGGGNRVAQNPDLAALLTKETKQSLETYRTERDSHWKTDPAKITIIATFLQDELHWPGVDTRDLYTVFNVMGWPAPRNINATIGNARLRYQYFGGEKDGKYELTLKGENFGRYDSTQPKSPKKK